MCSGNVVHTSKVRNAITLCCHVKNHKKYKAHVKNNFYVKYLPFVQIDTGSMRNWEIWMDYKRKLMAYLNFMERR